MAFDFESGQSNAQFVGLSKERAGQVSEGSLSASRCARYRKRSCDYRSSSDRLRRESWRTPPWFTESCARSHTCW